MLLRLRYYCLLPATVRPGQPAVFNFKFDLDESERASELEGRRLLQEQPPPKPERVQPTGQPATPPGPPPLMQQTASSTRA